MNTLRRCIVALLIVAGLTACTTRLLPEAENMLVTKKADDVRGCKLLGMVSADPPFRTSSDAKNRLRNSAALMGADTLFLLQHSIGTAEAGAYKCER